MAEIINLRRIKRTRARAAADDAAAANRAAHGRTRAERDASIAQDARQQRLLDGAKLSGDGEAGE